LIIPKKENMKFRNIKYALLGLIALTIVSCEKETPLELSPVYPLAGEWMVYYYNADGTKAAAGVAAIRLYNTADNVSTQAWIRAGTTQIYAIWGKTTVDVAARTITGTTINNDARPATSPGTFSILEGKVLEGATKVPSGIMADSIYVRYSTTADGKTYFIKGHRRTRFDGTE
jgi:hypothetical protein